MFTATGCWGSHLWRQHTAGRSPGGVSELWRQCPAPSPLVPHGILPAPVRYPPARTHARRQPRLCWDPGCVSECLSLMLSSPWANCVFLLQCLSVFSPAEKSNKRRAVLSEDALRSNQPLTVNIRPVLLITRRQTLNSSNGSLNLLQLVSLLMLTVVLPVRLPALRGTFPLPVVVVCCYPLFIYSVPSPLTGADTAQEEAETGGRKLFEVQESWYPFRLGAAAGSAAGGRCCSCGELMIKFRSSLGGVPPSVMHAGNCCLGSRAALILKRLSDRSYWSYWY